MNSIYKTDFNILDNKYLPIFNKLKKKNILVTGAYGMINTYLTRYLCHLAERYSFDLFLQCRNLSKGIAIFKELLNDKVHVIDFPLEKPLPQSYEFDYILHGASPASTNFFLNWPVDVIEPNVIGTWNLLNYCRFHDVQKMTVFSSNSIYGVYPQEKACLEEKDYGIVDPVSERGSYIESKRMAEQMCVAFCRQYGVRANATRICHTYGPNFNLDEDKRIIPASIKKIVNDEDIVIFDDPNSFIQYTYVADIISGILLVLLKGESGTSYNVCGETITNMEQIIDIMIHANENITSKLVLKQIDETYSFAQGKGVNFSKLSNNKLKKLGWKELFPVSVGLKNVVNHYYYIRRSKNEI